MKIEPKLFVSLFLGFILATVVGTLSHEFAHYFFGKMVGIDSEIHYAMTSIVDDSYATMRDYAWMIAGGPIQTMLTGTVGLLLLRSRSGSKAFTAGTWILVFITLFWLRPVFNAVLSVAFGIEGRLNTHSDETRLAEYFGLHPMSIVLATAAVGAGIWAHVFFRVIPKQSRLTFVISGLLGGIAGALFWLVYVGKLILP